MGEPFVGREAVACGLVTRSHLETRYIRLFRGVYIDRDSEVTAAVRAKAGWLWTGRRGIIAGFSASALHGSKWVDDRRTVELIHDNHHRPAGIQLRRDVVAADEIAMIGDLPVTSPTRTALDLGCWYPTTTAVAGIDALASATEIKAADIELLVRRYPGRRGIAAARRAADLFDAGSQSPKETWLRLLLVNAGLPRPQTQIQVLDEFGGAFAYVDMGWGDVKVAVEYDGEQHRSDRRQYAWDVRRLERLERLGWIVVRVVAGDRPGDIVGRVRAARSRRVPAQPGARRPRPV
ncbi:endonuclease domain-containing protein [Mycobacterium sp. 050134]|uniref:endonuclease domain-containing protein n=1 Tax=Mycobacterium sp. 050134 TaxID=3096111 RepID=UPI002EDB080D